MNTSDLTGPALAWAVAQANGDTDLDWFVYEGEFYFGSGPSDPAPVAFMPSRNWFDGGPIIEREKISLTYHENNGEPYWIGSVECQYRNFVNTTAYYEAYGETPLIAGMRCYVSAVFDEEIELPEGL